LVSVDGNTYANTGLSYVSTQSRYTYTITSGVTNGNSYIVRIKASNTVGNSTVALSNAISVFTVPDPPTINSLTPQVSAIDMSFSAPAFNGGNSITRYQYYLNGNTQTIANITITSQSGSINNTTISSLTNGNTYTIGIRAINARGVSDWSSTKTTIPFTVPNAPSVSVSAYNTYVRLFVTPPEYNGGNTITGYQYSLYGNTASGTSIVNMGLPSPLQYDVSGLTNGTTYNVVVRAFNARGNSAWSSTVISIPNTVPDTPVLNTATSLASSIAITFSTPFDGGSPIIGYYYSVDNGNTYTSTGSTANTYTITTNITNGNTYTVRVKNENKNGQSTIGSNAISVIPFTTPDSPSLLDVVSGINSVTMVFREPNNNGGNTITKYEYSTNGGSTFTSIGIPTLDASTNSFRYITYNQSSGASLVNGQSYSVVIRASNSRGNSPSSNTISVVPFDVPQPPTLISATSGKELVRIVYSAPTNNGGNTITQYEYILNGTRFFIENASTASQSYGMYQYVYTGLAVGDNYEVSVIARNARGSSTPSNSIIVIPSGPPQAPTITVIPQDTYAEISFYPPNDSGNAIVRYEYSTNGGNTYAIIAAALPTVNGKNAFNVYDLSNGIPYTVAVRSVNLLGTSGWSNKPVIMPYTIPVEPTITGIIPLRGGIQIVLNSTANNGGNTITSYKFAYVAV
jgi:titin